MKVYVVKVDHIDSVWSTKELAEAQRRRLTDRMRQNPGAMTVETIEAWWRVEEYEVDTSFTRFT